MTTYFSPTADERERRMLAWAIGYKCALGSTFLAANRFEAIATAVKVICLPQPP